MTTEQTHTYPVVETLINGRGDGPLIGRVVYAAGMILSCYRRLNMEAEKKYPDDSHRRHWHAVDLKQAYLDSLRSLMMAGLIDHNGYDLEKWKVKIGGVWYETQASKITG